VPKPEDGLGLTCYLVRPLKLSAKQVKSRSSIVRMCRLTYLKPQPTKDGFKRYTRLKLLRTASSDLAAPKTICNWNIAQAQNGIGGTIEGTGTIEGVGWTIERIVGNKESPVSQRFLNEVHRGSNIVSTCNLSCP
jgi:hypothetical protein